MTTTFYVRLFGSPCTIIITVLCSITTHHITQSNYDVRQPRHNSTAEWSRVEWRTWTVLDVWLNKRIPFLCNSSSVWSTGKFTFTESVHVSGPRITFTGAKKDKMEWNLWRRLVLHVSIDRWWINWCKCQRWHYRQWCLCDATNATQLRRCSSL